VYLFDALLCRYGVDDGVCVIHVGDVAVGRTGYVHYAYPPTYQRFIQKKVEFVSKHWL